MLERSMILSLSVIVLINIMDSVMGSIQGPSVIFYVEMMGGTLQQYGLLSSVSSVSTLIMVSVYGNWVDSNGNKYHPPYTCTFLLGIIGSLIYFMAIVMPRGNWAIGTMMLGNFIRGMGGAGKTLAYSYVATTIPLENQKKVLSILSSTRTFGSLLGPPANLLVAEIDSSISILGLTIPLNPYNTVGLIVALGECILWLYMILFLKEPPTKEKPTLTSSTTSKLAQDEVGWGDIIKALMHFDMIFPLIQAMVILFGFTLAGLGLAPIGAHLFGWVPLQISYVSTVGSVIMFGSMMIVMYLSFKNVTDFSMLVFGNIVFAISGSLTYVWWRVDTGTVLRFTSTFLMLFFGYPFMGPSNRSAYNRAIHNRPELASKVGVLNGLYVQAFTIGGVIFPVLISKYVLREPSDVNLSSPHEMTPLALLIPICSLLIIVGLLYEEFILGENELGLLPKSEVEKGAIDETSKLVDKQGRRRSSIAEINQTFSRVNEVNRQLSTSTVDGVSGINGMCNPCETAWERKVREELIADQKEWDEITNDIELMDESTGRTY